MSVNPMDDASPPDQEQVEEIVRRGPAGAFAVAGLATAIVVALFIAFYIFVYLPRGAVQ
jgi:hypothetical protein